MGADIHGIVQVQNEQGLWQEIKSYFSPDEWEVKSYGADYKRDSPFEDRNYGVFGFLADVRNYSKVPTVGAYQGFPKDLGVEIGDDSTHSWGRHTNNGHSGHHVYLSQLLDFDYEQTFEDLRVNRQIAPNLWDGGCTGDPGEGKLMTIREFLGKVFFKDLQELATLGEPDKVRFVFYFDS